MKTKFLTLLLFAFTFCELTSLGQSYNATPVTVSQDKIRDADGRVFYAHSVKERQTLYSICKAYGVELADVYAANPGLEEKGLQMDSVILIPVENSSKKASKKTKDAEEVADSDAQNLDSEVEEPAEDDSRKNDKGKKRDKKEDGGQVEGKDYVIHVVRWYEDIDDIAAKYNVPASYIMSYNGMTGRRMKTKTRLKIPLVPQEGTAVLDEDERVSEQLEEDTEAKIGDTQEEWAYDWSMFKKKDKVNVVLLMPFNSSGNTPNPNSMDFYCGVLMAVREIGQQETVKIELSSIDYEQGVIPTEGLEALSTADVAIGPIAEEGLRAVLNAVPSGCCVVSPLNQKAAGIAGLYPNFVQAPPTSSAQYLDIADWVKRECQSGDKVLVITEKNAKNITGVEEFNNILNSSGLEVETFSYALSEGRNISQRMGQVMVTEGVNRVILNSENEAFAVDVVRNLDVMLFNKFSTILYAPSKIHSFSSLDTESLHKLQLRVSMSYFPDYDSQELKDFLLAYRALFNAEPTQFSYQGYDVAKYFIEACADYGNRWSKKIDFPTEDRLLQLDFCLNQQGEGQGFCNVGVRRVEYGEDFSVVLLP